MDTAPALCSSRDAQMANGGSAHDYAAAAALDAALAAVAAAEARSLRLQDRSRRIIETASDAFVGMDATGTVIDWNAQAERTFGWARDEILGRKVVDTILPAEARQGEIGDIERFLATGRAPVLGQRNEMWGRHRGGHLFPVELAIWATSDGDDGDGLPTFHAFIHDITARRRGEDERRRLAAIVESSDEAIIGASPDGTILTWNRGAESLFGYNAAEAVGQPVSMVASSEQRDDLDRKTHAVGAGRGVHGHEVKGVRKNGVMLDVSMTISPIADQGGDVAGLSIVARDVTEQRWMANTLNATLQSLEKALLEAKESEARCRRFTGDAAHQLRTPIAGIRACAETLLRGASDDQRDALLADVVRETGRAARLMTGLLQMARVDQGLVLAPQRCDVVRVCSEEVERARALSPNLEILTRVESRLSRAPELDAHAVHEILSNLLDNARRHAGNRIEVVVGARDDQVEIRVVDDGPGMSEAMAERAFQRFVSLDSKGGSGLGLPIGRGLARTHGGDLTYEESAFVLRLPVEADIDCGGASRPDFDPPEMDPDWESWQAP